MEQFWSFLKTLVLVGGLIVVVLLVLLAMPQSRLRIVVLKLVAMFFYCVTGIAILLFISPIDLLPFLPVEDVAYLVGGIVTTVLGYGSSRAAKARLPRRKGETRAVLSGED